MDASKLSNKPKYSPLGQKPKRPLSAFNLFYRFKRQMVLHAISHSNADKGVITRLVNALPGLEHHHGSTIPPLVLCTMNDMRRNSIRTALEKHLLPRDTRDRAHRTNQGAMNGAMSFLELGKLMNASWKNCDDVAKTVFNELADEGRDLYRGRLKDYNDRASSMGIIAECLASLKTKKATSSKKKKLPLKKNVIRKASPTGVEERDNGSPSNEMVGSKRGHSPSDSMVQSHGYQISDPRNAREAPPSAIDRQQFNTSVPDFRAHLDNANALMTLASTDTDTLRTVSKDCSSMSEHHPNLQHSHQPDYPDVNLRARVKELESQLTAERLRARVRELEGDLARQRSVEAQLRAQLCVFSRNHFVMGAPSAAPASVIVNHKSDAPPMQGDGLWSLVSASMIHPSVRSQERSTGMFSRMAPSGRNVPAVRRALPCPRMKPIDDVRQRDLIYDESPNKKQRCN